MKKFWQVYVTVIGMLLLIWMVQAPKVYASEARQQPTVSIPTVTGTAVGPTIIVNSDQDQINVRSGPGTDYPKVGILIAGQESPAIGRSPGGNWIQIVYPGVEGGEAWVYAFLVSGLYETLPIVEPPSTPTPATTPTVDPTLAAQFDIQSTPTRLPTFTPPPPLVVQDYEDASVGLPLDIGGVPSGMLIIALAVIGLFGLVISLLRRG